MTRLLMRMQGSFPSRVQRSKTLEEMLNILLTSVEVNHWLESDVVIFVLLGFGFHFFHLLAGREDSSESCPVGGDEQ